MKRFNLLELKSFRPPFDEDEDEDLDSLPFSHFISKSRLHWIWSSTRNIPASTLNRLESAGLEVTRGRYTEKEDKRIKKNWKRWCRQFPDLSDPFLAFGLNHRPEHMAQTEGRVFDDTYVVPTRIRMKFKRLHFMKRIAYKLDTRLICDLYTRAKRLLVFNEFKRSFIRDVDEELVDEVVQRVFETKETRRNISSELNISPDVVSSIKNTPIRVTSHRWSAVDDLLLEEILQRQFENENIWYVPSYKIDWKRAEKDMVSCGYKLIKRQMYKRWLRRNPPMFGLRRIK